MKIFISWSGDRSRVFAEALRDWLPKLINAVEPWLSSSDIDKGSRWSVDVATRLQECEFGILCLTPGNLHSDWILFEAGALSKSLERSRVCPLLLDLEPSDVSWPLAQFQATKLSKEEVHKLVLSINAALPCPLSEAHVVDVFDTFWPRLEERIKSLPSEAQSTGPGRTEKDLLEEVLSLVRRISLTVGPPLKSPPRPSRAEERRSEELDPYEPGDRIRGLLRRIIEDRIKTDPRREILFPKVQSALERIDRGEYGFCQACEERISEKRLNAMPWAEYCVHCADLADSVNAN